MSYADGQFFVEIAAPNGAAVHIFLDRNKNKATVGMHYYSEERGQTVEDMPQHTVSVVKWIMLALRILGYQVKNNL